MTTTEIAWLVVLSEQHVTRRAVVAHSLRIVDGCLEFTRDGLVVHTFARGAWLEANLDE
jgi:hypothetical protein